MAQFQTAPFTLYDTAMEEFLNGAQDWDTDDHRVVLLSSSYTPSGAHSTYADISAHIIVDVDYDPVDLLGETVLLSGSDSLCDASDVNFGNTVTLTARYAAIVVGTVAMSSGTDALVGYILLNKNGEDVVSNADAFAITWSGSGIFSTRIGGITFSTTEVPVIPNNAAAPSDFEGDGRDTTSDQFRIFGALPAPSTSTLYNLIDHGWEADFGISAGDGASVALWEPIIGDVNLAQATYYPVFRATAATNGLPSIEFTGTGDATPNQPHLDAIFSAAISQPNTVIIVVEVNTAGATRTYFDTYNAGNRNRLAIETGPTWAVYAGTSITTNYPAPATGLQFIAVRFNDNSILSGSEVSEMDIDGTNYQGTGSSGTNTMDDFRVGANVSAINGGDFYCHAIYITGRRLSNSEINEMREYCQTKWSTT